MNIRMISGLLGILLIVAGPLFAQAESEEAIPYTESAEEELNEEDDPNWLERGRKEGKILSRLPGYEFKIDGVIFTGYELNDYDQVGRPDTGGPTKDSAGFRVNRAYINFRGGVTDGDYKGWGFRITTDIARSAELGDGCGDTCSEDNDNDVNLKYAYIYVPVPFLDRLYGQNSVRLGQQHVPMVDAQDGVSLQRFWDHRYIDQSATEKVGMSSSTDLGLSFIHRSDYLGIHLLLGNGEGYHHQNAENVQNSSVQNLARGEGDSYGMDLYGMFSVVPTGKSKTYTWAISTPFRLHNFTGVSDEESRFFTADVSSGPGTFDILYREGDTRAKRDLSYGLESDLKIDFGTFMFTVGFGNVTRIDKRGAVTTWRLQPGTSTGSVDDTLNRVENRDAVGFANYIFAHVRWRNFGAFGRYIRGTSTTSLSSKFSPIEQTSWAGQALALDAADGQFGNLSLSTADNSIDHGEGRYDNIIYGLTFFPSAVANFFRISVGVSELYGTNQTGREYRTNVFERYTGAGSSTGNTDTVASQLENNTAIKANLGYGSNDTLVLNDFIGSKIDTRQVFVRAQFLY
ncbi:MAG: hypothetical protein NXI24_06645 [bacterium]|nr:hypothetical protein [bacterium]